MSATTSGKRVYFRNVHRSRILMRLRTPPGSTVQFSDPWSCPCARSLGSVDVKDVNGNLHARSPCVPLRAATCAANAPRPCGQEDMRGFDGRVRIETHHAPQKTIDGPSCASILDVRAIESPTLQLHMQCRTQSVREMWCTDASTKILVGGGVRNGTTQR